MEWLLRRQHVNETKCGWVANNFGKGYLVFVACQKLIDFYFPFCSLILSSSSVFKHFLLSRACVKWKTTIFYHAMELWKCYSCQRKYRKCIDFRFCHPLRLMCWWFLCPSFQIGVVKIAYELNYEKFFTQKQTEISPTKWRPIYL